MSRTPARRVMARVGLATLSSLALSVGALAAAAGSANAAAPNPYSPAYQHPYRHGAVPTRETASAMQGWAASHHVTPNASGSGQLRYGGGVDGIGVTTGAPRVYLVVYGSQWGTASTNSQGDMTLSGDSVGEVPRLQELFKGIGTNGEQWSGVDTQYCEGISAGSTSCPSGAAHVGYPTGGAFAGIWYDNSVSSPSSATGHQLGTEAVKAAGHFGNTTSSANRNAQYVILSPHGTTPDGFNAGGGFCAWHDWNGDSSLSGGAVSSSYGDIAFTNMPYVTDAGSSCGQGFVNSGSAGTLDGVTMVEGHEYAETITDQNPAGGWTDSSGYENADKCAWISSGTGASANVTFSTGTFAMQSTYSNDVSDCQMYHAIVGGGGGGTNDFSMSVSPTSGSVTAGGSVSATVSTSTTAGSAQTVSLSASGLP
ncbi:MAG TPA: hypothetical protein VF054_10590, partial [Micromonosporaceae bacterium]